MPKSLMFLLILLPLSLGVFVTGAQLTPAAAQTNDEPQSGTLRQIIPGYHVYTSGPRISGVIETDEGVVVIDALNEAMAMDERQLIADMIGQPVRYLISATHHNNYSLGNAAYEEAIKIGHEDYRADLIEQMEADGVPAADQEARLPDLTFSESMSLYVGGKEFRIIHIGPGHTRGDSVVLVPEDGIVYTSEAFFYERFPFMNTSYLAWIDAIDTILSLDADIIVPGNGVWAVDDPQTTRQALIRSRQVLVDARDAVQREIDQGATEDQTAERISLQEYDDLVGYEPQSEIMVRRIYQELTGAF